MIASLLLAAAMASPACPSVNNDARKVPDPATAVTIAQKARTGQTGPYQASFAQGVWSVSSPASSATPVRICAATGKVMAPPATH